MQKGGICTSVKGTCYASHTASHSVKMEIHVKVSLSQSPHRNFGILVKWLISADF
jgi:hypothetical protein